jgi:hypothetical protein
MLSAHGLIVANIRGQWYDVASNMRGEFNGRQKLIRDENHFAFYIHCFTHQLQLVVVVVTKCCSSIDDFFDNLIHMMSHQQYEIQNFKMINLIHMISILNSVFTIVLYAMRWTKQDLIYICFKKI